MSRTQRLVFDLLKPHSPTMMVFAQAIANLDGVDGVNAQLIETDRETQTIALTVEGADLSYETIEESVEELGGTVHSIDEVVCGETLVEGRRAPPGRWT